MGDKYGGFVIFKPWKDHEDDMPSHCFVLGDRHVPVEVGVDEWLEWSLNGGGELAEDTVGEMSVTTQFIGFDVGEDPANPKMFETVVYGEALEPNGEVFTLDMHKLAATYEEAMQNHAIGLQIVREVLHRD